MPARKSHAPRAIYQIKITLLHTRPPIWRRLLAPSEMNLEDLHAMVQAAMPWDGDHLHDFRIGQRRFGRPNPEHRMMGEDPDIDEGIVRLASVLDKVGAKARYTYDFGDDWQHEIAVEKVLAPEPGKAYPVCIDGKRAGPPEDCGGVWGYHGLLEAIADPKHEQHGESKDWLGDEYDPEAFSVEDVNRRLAYLQRR